MAPCMRSHGGVEWNRDVIVRQDAGGGCKAISAIIFEPLNSLANAAPFSWCFRNQFHLKCM